MLRHTGERRSFIHNLRLAILLCLNAGFINVAALMAFSVLTTNVTGHVAHLARHLALEEFRDAFLVSGWICCFLSGVFFTALFTNLTGRHTRYSYSIPLVFIVLLLLLVAFGSGKLLNVITANYAVGVLLFCMGMQNALVTMISGAVVRTTHLTGMLTDFGIDLAILALKGGHMQQVLGRRLLLKSLIIISFLAGGICGAFSFVKLEFNAFVLPACLLLYTIFYDFFRVRVSRAVRKLF